VAGEGKSAWPEHDLHGVNCGYYLRKRHGLIHRHTEKVALNADHTARWQLKVDFELPSHPDSHHSEDGRCIFLFPLAFMKKAGERTGFEVRDENDSLISVPIRTECDRISAFALAHASESLHRGIHPPPEIPLEKLEDIFELIAADKPFYSSMALHKVLAEVGLEGSQQVSSGVAALGRAWEENGLLETLHMLVDHSLVWVSLEGTPGERRSIVLTQDISMMRRVFFRWIVGNLTIPSPPWRHPFKTYRAINPNARYLRVGEKKYGRRTIRVSFSALGERIGQPLGWMPFEYSFPTVYAKRCRSYHFEVTCPPGRSPRGLAAGKDVPLAEPSRYSTQDPSEGRTVLTSYALRHDRPGIRFPTDLWFKITIGVGDGAFPALWFLTGAITSLMLWLLAGYAEEFERIASGENRQIAAAILLVVPALAAALAIGDNTVPVTRLIGGARILLLVIGLSAVAATAILIGAEPFGMEEKEAWTACAMIATVTTVPLATGWLLSAPPVWRQLKRLRSRRRQKRALWLGALLALLAVLALVLVCGDEDSAARGLLGGYLLVLAVGMTVLANNRVAMPIGQERRYVSLSMMLVALICLALGCIELQGVISGFGGLQDWAELVAFVGLIVALVAGESFSRLTERFAPDQDEIHVSPKVGQALLAGEAVRELALLRSRERATQQT